MKLIYKLVYYSPNTCRKDPENRTVSEISMRVGVQKRLNRLKTYSSMKVEVIN